MGRSHFDKNDELTYLFIDLEKIQRKLKAKLDP
jgi:hypothetical protein